MSIDFLDFVRIRPRANSIYTQANLSRIRESPCHAPKVVSQRVTTHLMAAAKAASRESEEVTNASHSCSTGIPAAATAAEDSCCCYCHCRGGCCGCGTWAAGGGRPAAGGRRRAAGARASVHAGEMDGWISEWTDGGTGAQIIHAQHTRTTTSTQVTSSPPKIKSSRTRRGSRRPRIKSSLR